MQLGEWIKAYRKEQGLSMQNFADLCGFSKAYIGQLEKGINPKTKRPMSPTMQTFTKIATSVGLSVDQLLERLDADQPVSITKTETSAPAARPESSQSARKKGVRIPVLGRVVSGIPIEAVQEYDDWEEIPEEMARRGEYFALRFAVLIRSSSVTTISSLSLDALFPTPFPLFPFFLYVLPSLLL